MKILIVEDEVHIARHLSSLVLKLLKDKSAKTRICLSFNEALFYISENEVDLLLLDLNLKGKDGFQILKLAISQSFHVIIVSAHVEKAIEAFEYGVLDFIPKPFSEDRLQKALDRVYNKGDSSKNKTKYLVIKKKNRLITIEQENILYFEAYGHYSKIHLDNGKIELCDKSLVNLEFILGDKFERIHKSYIAKIPESKSILVFPGGKYFLEMKNDDKIPIGRSIYKYIKGKWFSDT